jgi:hypothetical protein
MLREFYTYLTTNCPQYLRHMDYLYEIIAMRNRHRRHQTSWMPHLQNTRRFILSAAQRCQNRNKVVILGSGLLLDVPLLELTSMFREVVLVDIVFLPEVWRAVKRLRNVKLFPLDITNMAQKLYENVRCGIRELPKAAPSFSALDGDTGLVVSLNLLSQLWVMPRAYALKKLQGLDAEEVDDWCGQIVNSHYAFLQLLPCAVSLVTDFEFVKRDKTGCIASYGSTIFNLRLPAPEESWTWNIAPMAENRGYLSKELNVGAWHML